MEGYLSPAEAASARIEFHRLFLTAKDIGTVVDVTLTRDMGGNTGIINIEYEDVLLTLAARQADTNTRGGGVRTTTTQGQLAKESYPEAPFEPKAGDRFVIKGKSGRVIVAYPEMNNIVRADIMFDNPYG
jgi:hypothetical protein